MSPRERILAVYRRETPDVVPYMLDLSHWFYHRRHMPWDLSTPYDEPVHELIDYHRTAAVGIYLAQRAGFFDVKFAPDVKSSVTKSEDGGEIRWELQTPLGAVRRRRVWEEETYSWGIPEWGIRSEQDLKVFAYAMAGRTYWPNWDIYRTWADAIGDAGVVYLTLSYSGMGSLLRLWMGIEGTAYAVVDWPDTMREVVDQINANNLKGVDLMAESPAEIIIMGDNHSSDVQSPGFFERWSRAYYQEAIRRLHAAGKHVAIHIDGRLRGALGMFRDVDADCADAVTPTPMGDLTPEQCRQEAGPDMILSGGISPDLWLPNAPLKDFKAAVRRWLDLKKHSPRLIANAGDQVPPGAEEDRIHLMRDMVERHGKY